MRWLSIDAATPSIHDDFMAVLQTVRQIKDNDAVAAGLLRNIVSFLKFIGTVSKNFQQRHVNFSHIQPSFKHTTD